jgi:ectoine hydroxylase-related dioxygenase (phytanoyl-CoA dioxygenase family)
MNCSSEWKTAYERDGYLIFNPEVPTAILDGIIEDIREQWKEDKYITEIDYIVNKGARILNAWRLSENVKALALASKVLSLLEVIYGRKPKPFQTLNFRVGSEQPVHSDTIHFNSSPPGYMCGVWVALEDIDMENGPLVYYPGSHTLPEITMAELGLSGGAENYTHYENFLADLLARSQAKPHYGTIQKGQALLWAANLLHGGSRQQDKNRTRLSQVTHYYFEGCKHHMPYEANGREMVWWQPKWIT